MTRDVYLGKLEAAVAHAVRAADWEPGDAQRALQGLRDRFEELRGQGPGNPPRAVRVTISLTEAGGLVAEAKADGFLPGDALRITALSVRGARREITGRMINAGFAPTGAWSLTASDRYAIERNFTFTGGEQ